MKYKINIENAGKKTPYNIPSTWGDVTVQQFYDLKKSNPNDIVETLSILTGCPYGIMSRTKTYDIVETVQPIIAFLNRPMLDKENPPVYKIKINERHFPAPKDLTRYSLAQKLAACDAIEQAEKEFNGNYYMAIHKIVAIYFYPIVTGKEFDLEDPIDQELFDAFEKELLKCSALEVYEVADFFLSRLLRLRKRNVLPYPLNLIRNKWLRGYVNLVYSKKSIRLMHWQGVMYSDGKK